MNAYKSVIGAVFAAAAILPAAAFATTCPADKAGVDVRQMDSTPAKDVTDNVIASIDVAKEPAAIPGRLFRMRQLTIKPGGVVPWHSHANRPAIIYVVKGEVTEYASSCSVPLVHKTGDATPELHVTAHWWKNTGKTTAILISADLLPVDATDPHTM
ncbi:MAG: cupin domain-containing protein [Asticcacaulis sp.]|nr:cupin domain-containing protein [Asticcacaulis sp.]